MIKSKMLSNSAAGALSVAVMSGVAYAQLDEIVVTATKRAESANDVPIAVQALGGDALDELRVDTFEDYLLQLPGVTAGGSGPGQSTIYIRGLASTTPNLTTAGVAGIAPNVSLYLDEQPLAQPGRNLDVYTVDLNRVEVLSGPQGTLFGASSQAGVVRLITNKPNLEEFEAKANFGISATDGGDESYKANFIVNLPLSDKFAVRGVVYTDEQGGYIDNVFGERDLSESARYRPAGTPRSNGVPVSNTRAGLSSNFGANNINFESFDNADLVESNFNDTNYTGYRISALYEFNDDWSLLVANSGQETESDGVFFDDPTLGDFQIQRFREDTIDDEYTNTNWTLEGRIGALEAIYTGAFTDRDTDQQVDYSDYLFVGQYLPYYICDYYTTYTTAAGATLEGDCNAPDLLVTSFTDTEVITHELRFNTPAEHRLRATFGGFYSDLELDEQNDFVYPGFVNVDVNNDGVPEVFPDNFVTTAIQTPEGTPLPPESVFRNDVRRTDEQIGIFGEATFDFNEQFALTVGARYYDIEVDLEGSANSSFCNLFGGTDEDAFGTNISDLYDGDGVFTFISSCTDDLRRTFALPDADNAPAGAVVVSSIADIQAVDARYSDAQAAQIFNSLNAPDAAETDGVIVKVTGTWTPTDDLLFYATYSEGFRPGLLNRPGGVPNPSGTFVVPFELDTDEVENFELGWKTTLANNELQWNGSLFFVEVSDLQTTIFDPTIVNLFFSANAADAEIIGLESDITWAPSSVPGLTVAGAISLLDTEVTDVLIPTGDVDEGDSLAFAPDIQGNIRARYEWEVAGGKYTAHIQPQVTYSDSSFGDIININRAEIDSWTKLDLSAGISGEKWSAEIFGDNLSDERIELNNTFTNDRDRVTVARPLTVGLRFSVKH